MSRIVATSRSISVPLLSISQLAARSFALAQQLNINFV